jgi:hypothetical protein
MTVACPPNHTIEDIHMAVSSDHRLPKKEPWMTINIAIVGTVLLTFLALHRIYAVAHGDYTTALAILQSSGTLSQLVGILLSNMQINIELLAIFALILYLETEFPAESRHNQELSTRGTFLIVSWLLLIVAGSWPLALISLLVGIPFVMGRLFALWLPRYRRPETDEARLSVPRGTRRFPAFRMGHRDGQRRAMQVTESRLQADVLTGLVNRRARSVLLLMLLVGLFAYVESDRAWFPPEAITIQGHARRVGYVLDIEGGSYEILWDRPRRISRVPISLVKDRRFCDATETTPTLGDIVIRSEEARPYRGCYDKQ